MYLFAQTTGGGLLLNGADDDLYQMGAAIVLTGLVIQLGSFAACCWIACVIHAHNEHKLKYMLSLASLFTGFLVIF